MMTIPIKVTITAKITMLLFFAAKSLFLLFLLFVYWESTYIYF